MNKRESLIKIYTQNSPKKDLELSIESSSLLISEILKLEASLIKKEGINFMDLNPIYGKTFIHFSINDFIKNSTAVIGDSNSFRELLSFFNLEKCKVIDESLLNITQFGNVNLFIDFKREYKETEHVWNSLKLNDILISCKKIKNERPIKILNVNFIGFKSSSYLYIYRKPFIPGGLNSRYGI